MDLVVRASNNHILKPDSGSIENTTEKKTAIVKLEDSSSLSLANVGEVTKKTFDEIGSNVDFAGSQIVNTVKGILNDNEKGQMARLGIGGFIGLTGASQALNVISQIANTQKKTKLLDLIQSATYIKFGLDAVSSINGEGKMNTADDIGKRALPVILITLLNQLMNKDGSMPAKVTDITNLRNPLQSIGNTIGGIFRPDTYGQSTISDNSGPISFQPGNYVDA